nr:PD40 domain-containing protein [Bacteroidota bacterium]
MKTPLTLMLLFLSFLITAQELTQITNDPSRDWDPHFSPDGNYFCFTSGRTGHDEIWKMTVTGDSLQQLTFDENGNMHPNWSPMG